MVTILSRPQRRNESGAADIEHLCIQRVLQT